MSPRKELLAIKSYPQRYGDLGDDANLRLNGKFQMWFSEVVGALGYPSN